MAGEEILTQLEEIQQKGLQQLEGVQDEESLESWRSEFLGRKAPVMTVFSKMGEASKEMRPLIGQKANEVKATLESALEVRTSIIKQGALERSLRDEKLDVTLPGRHNAIGRLHPSNRNLREIYHIFAEMGFQVYISPDVETDEFNFGLLNIPEYHPARDMWDTFWTTDDLVLRTHTSPGQIHSMRMNAPDPIRFILPGMCYRYEQVTARHEIQFNQVEAIVVGRNITFADMKGTLNTFARRMFGEAVRTRLRPSYFPFTEPSAEMDVECFVCGGKGCQICKGAGWLEIMGCGMINPIVLQNGGYDPAVYSGFAAGLGPERIALLRYRIDDIRNFWANDVRFLEQF